MPPFVLLFIQTLQQDALCRVDCQCLKVSDKLRSSQQTEYFEPQGKRPDVAASQVSKGCPGSETRSDIGRVSKSRMSSPFREILRREKYVQGDRQGREDGKRNIVERKGEGDTNARRRGKK